MDEAGRHPVRAALHSLTLGLGVSATVLALAVGHGAARAAARPIEGLPPNLVVVSATSASSSGVEVGLPTGNSLTPDDALALGAAGFVPDAVRAVPTAGLRTDVVAVDRSWHTDVIGSTSGFAVARGYSLANGRLLTDADVATAAPVVVIGQTLVAQLFAGDDPVGQSVQIDTQAFEVVGVLKGRGFSGTFNLDDLAIVPITSAWADLLKAGTPIDQVLIQSVSVARAAAVKTEATSTLAQRHHITNPATADFEVRTVKDLAVTQRRTARAVEHTLGLAALALLLGGAIHLDSLAGGGRWGKSIDNVSTDEEPSLRSRNFDTLTRGLIGTLMGIILGVVLAPAMRHLVGGGVSADVNLLSVVWGVAIGLLVSGVSCLPGSLESPRVSSSASSDQ